MDSKMDCNIFFITVIIIIFFFFFSQILICFDFVTTAILEKEDKWAASRQNQKYGMYAQRRLRSAWASTQSDQSLRCPHEESLGP